MSGEMSGQTSTTISVIVPTRGRPEQLRAAIKSVLAQTLPASEILVVVDGPDEASTIDVLNELTVSAQATSVELRWFVQAESAGPSAARNRGLDAAAGQWIAFLDDDDLWFPSKLARQVAMCQRSSSDAVIGAHAVVRRSPSGTEVVMADRTPTAGESIAAFLFCRSRMGGRKGHLLTPTLLLNRVAADQVRFDETLRIHEDWDLLLRLEALGAHVEYLAEPLAQWSIRSDDLPYSQGAVVNDWKFELDWANRRRHLLGERGYSGFCLSIAGDKARAARSLRGSLAVVRAAASGSPSFGDGATYLATALPERLRDRLARRWG